MNLIKKTVFNISWLALALAIFLMSSGASVFATKPSNSSPYKFISTNSWQKDLEASAPEEGYEHFYFTEDSTVDLLISKYQGDLQFQDLNQTQEQILKGKNWVQSFVSDTPVSLLNINAVALKNGEKKITYRTQYKIGESDFSTYEIITTHASVYLQFVLRWNQKSDPAMVKKSLEAFQKIDFEASK